ncbi:hypothetical protein [Arthrobacter sp. LjRoot14]|uniref:hypothetical protein n=1 Tax=Arthrobacter sp. LjRoot14 TaxID=3342265 RepID=UPI003ECF1F1D
MSFARNICSKIKEKTLRQLNSLKTVIAREKYRPIYWLAGSVFLGLILILLSAVTSEVSWLSGTLSSAGVTSAFAGLIYLFTSALSATQKRIDQRVSFVQNDVNNIENALEVQHEEARNQRMNEVGTRVREAALAPWEAQDAQVRFLHSNVSFSSVRSAISMAYEERLLSHKGPRVPIYDTDLVVRFELPDDPDTINCHIEEETGKWRATHFWSTGESETSILTRINRTCIDILGHNQGVFPEKIFPDLADLILYCSQARRGTVAGDPRVVRNVIQFASGWVVTDDSIFPKERISYVIEADQIQESGWPEHIHRKGWDDAAGIDLALAVARTLIDPAKQETKRFVPTNVAAPVHGG